MVDFGKAHFFFSHFPGGKAQFVELSAAQHFATSARL
jgi:hypothetical protein